MVPTLAFIGPLQLDFSVEKLAGRYKLAGAYNGLPTARNEYLDKYFGEIPCFESIEDLIEQKIDLVICALGKQDVYLDLIISLSAKKPTILVGASDLELDALLQVHFKAKENDVSCYCLESRTAYAWIRLKKAIAENKLGRALSVTRNSQNPRLRLHYSEHQNFYSLRALIWTLGLEPLFVSTLQSSDDCDFESTLVSCADNIVVRLISQIGYDYSHNAVIEFDSASVALSLEPEPKIELISQSVETQVIHIHPKKENISVAIEEALNGTPNTCMTLEQIILAKLTTRAAETSAAQGGVPIQVQKV